MRTPTSTRPYRTPEAVRDPVARTLAVMRGSTPGAAHQMELRLKSQMLTLMHAYRSAGRPERGQRFLADLAHALAPDQPVLSTALIRRAQEADAAEEELETRWLTDRTPANARAWRIGLETANALANELARALRAHEEAQ